MVGTAAGWTAELPVLALTALAFIEEEFLLVIGEELLVVIGGELLLVEGTNFDGINADFLLLTWEADAVWGLDEDSVGLGAG